MFCKTALINYERYICVDSRAQIFSSVYMLYFKSRIEIFLLATLELLLSYVLDSRAVFTIQGKRDIAY